MSTYSVHIGVVCVCAHPPMQMAYLCSFSADCLSLSISPAFYHAHPVSFCALYTVFIFVLWSQSYMSPNTAECWMQCGQFLKETEQGEGRMVETCARSCVLWSICLHRPFKLLPQSPALPLWLASAGLVAASDNVTWGVQWFIACSEMLNFLLGAHFNKKVVQIP